MSEATVTERETHPDRVALARRLLESSADISAVVIHRATAIRLVDEAFDHGRRFGMAEAVGDRVCRVCGCTQFDACRPEPCSWADDDLCSACLPFTEASQ